MKSLLALAVLSIPVAGYSATQSVHVTGKCQIKVKPDLASASFTAEAIEKDQQKAVAKVTALVIDLTAKIKELNLKGLILETSSYNVSQQKEWENNKMVDKGYRADITLNVTAQEPQKMGETLTLASKAGITNVGQLRMFLSLEKEKSEYLKCLDIASADAKAKADQLAKNFKTKVDEVMEISEQQNISSPAPMFERAMLKGGNSAADASVPLEAGEQLFSTQIEVKFSLK